MYVCICHGVTERAIHAAAALGADSLPALTLATGCSASCGCCAELACRVLDEARRGQVVSICRPDPSIAAAA